MVGEDITGAKEIGLELGEVISSPEVGERVGTTCCRRGEISFIEGETIVGGGNQVEILGDKDECEAGMGTDIKPC